MPDAASPRAMRYAIARSPQNEAQQARTASRKAGSVATPSTESNCPANEDCPPSSPTAELRTTHIPPSSQVSAT